MTQTTLKISYPAKVNDPKEWRHAVNKARFDMALQLLNAMIPGGTYHVRHAVSDHIETDARVYTIHAWIETEALLVNCTTCGSPCARHCPECGKPLCLICYQRYEVASDPQLCLICQSAIDMDWIKSNFTSLRRTWPLLRY